MSIQPYRIHLLVPAAQIENLKSVARLIFGDRGRHAFDHCLPLINELQEEWRGLNFLVTHDQFRIIQGILPQAQGVKWFRCSNGIPNATNDVLLRTNTGTKTGQFWDFDKSLEACGLTLIPEEV